MKNIGQQQFVFVYRAFYLIIQHGESHNCKITSFHYLLRAIAICISTTN